MCRLLFATPAVLIHGQDNLGTNTYSSALLVGEKGADLLCEDLGEPIRSTCWRQA